MPPNNDESEFRPAGHVIDTISDRIGSRRSKISHLHLVSSPPGSASRGTGDLSPVVTDPPAVGLGTTKDDPGPHGGSPHLAWSRSSTLTW
jgi:hypothetical protein